MNETRWIVAEADPSAESLAQSLGISVKIAQVLLNRNICEPSQAQVFLYGSLKDLPDPFLLSGMKVAVERLRKAAARKETVLIFGDYDVDGVLSVVALHRALTTLGARVEYYIPNRLQEGYGLKAEHIQVVQEKGADVVISVDCGIKALNFVHEVSRRGVDVIITDHHQPGEDLPAALAVINPVARGACQYPNRHLAGIGVVFKLIQALFRDHPHEIQVPHYLKLVALGTIADVVPLTLENRILVKEGLQKLERVSNPGLKSLLSVCGLDGKAVRVSDVGFRIAPRINAAGRMGEADRAVQLFFTDSEPESLRLAECLDEMNASRQAIERRMYEQARQRVLSRDLHLRYKLLVLGCRDWHRGIIGIVASKLKDDFHRPVLLFSLDKQRASGSGRSIREFPLIDCLNHTSRFFHSYGGHPMAVGCELDAKDLPALKEAMNRFAEERLSDEDLKRKIRIDAQLDFDDIRPEFLNLISRLAPHGVGNPRPTFLTEGVEVAAEVRRLKEKHLKLLLKQRGRTFEALGWGKSHWLADLNKGCRIAVAYSLQFNQYLGEERLSLVLEDMRPS